MDKRSSLFVQSIDDEKSFTTLTPCANAETIFPSSLMLQTNKLERLYVPFFQVVKYLQASPGVQLLQATFFMKMLN